MFRSIRYWPTVKPVLKLRGRGTARTAWPAGGPRGPVTVTTFSTTCASGSMVMTASVRPATGARRATPAGDGGSEEREGDTEMGVRVQPVDERSIGPAVRRAFEDAAPRGAPNPTPLPILPPHPPPPNAFSPARRP